MPLLKLENVEASYDGVKALHGVNLVVNENELVVILGSNGAGKTTTLRAISNMLDVSGKIEFENKDITKLRTAQVAALGIAHVPDGRGTFPNLTVEENFQIGGILKRKSKNFKNNVEKMLVFFPALKPLYKRQAGFLSGGEQQMLAISRGLLMEPKLLLLDEPSMGLAPVIIQDIFKIIDEISKSEKMGIILVEQNANLALKYGKRVYLMEAGKTIREGNCAEFVNNSEIQKIYLGN